MYRPEAFEGQEFGEGEVQDPFGPVSDEDIRGEIEANPELKARILDALRREEGDV